MVCIRFSASKGDIYLGFKYFLGDFHGCKTELLMYFMANLGLEIVKGR